MAEHRTNPIHRILERPAVYDRLQRMVGAGRARPRIVREFIRPRAGDRLLDVGCGTGSLLDWLPSDVEYTGYDLNPAYIETSRRRYGPRGTFFVARVGDSIAGLVAESFDIVVAKALLHHLSDAEVLVLLQEARRLLRRGGVFVSIDPLRRAGQSPAARLLMSLDRGRCIRDADAYRALAAAHFTAVESHAVDDLLAVPYDHFVMRATA